MKICLREHIAIPRVVHFIAVDATLLAREGLDSAGIVASVRSKAAQLHTHPGLGGNAALPSLTLAQ